MENEMLEQAPQKSKTTEGRAVVSSASDGAWGNILGCVEIFYILPVVAHIFQNLLNSLLQRTVSYSM